MTTNLGPAAEQALTAYTDWLNAWHEGEGDFNGDGSPTRVTRDDYDLWDDPPTLIHEFREHFDADPGIYAYDDLMLIIRCSPYHDEGGHATLTGWFSYMTRDMSDGSLEGKWILETLMHEFDMTRSLIFLDGKLNPDALPTNDDTMKGN